MTEIKKGDLVEFIDEIGSFRKPLPPKWSTGDIYAFDFLERGAIGVVIDKADPNRAWKHEVYFIHWQSGLMLSISSGSLRKIS